MNPETPPEVDWNTYRAQISNKEVVSQLESAYKALKIPYPKDAVTPMIDQQEKDCQVTVQEFCKQSNAKIEEAKVLVCFIALNPSRFNLHVLYSVKSSVL